MPERLVPRAALPWLVLACRVGVAAVLIVAALPKLADPALFAEDIANYRMLPDAVIGPLAVALPIVELVIAAALLIGLEARGAALLAAGLLSVFGIAMAQAMARGIDLECGCFGGSVESQVGWGSLARNAALVVASAVVVAAPDARFFPFRRTEPSEPIA